MDKYFVSCRLCLKSDQNKEFKSIFESSDLRMKFERYFKISVSKIFFSINNFIKMFILQLFNDNINNREALICSPCVEILNEHYEFQQKVRKIDEIYFTPLRNVKIQQYAGEPKDPVALLFPFHNDPNDTEEEDSDNILTDTNEVLGLKIQNVHSLR